MDSRESEEIDAFDFRVALEQRDTPLSGRRSHIRFEVVQSPEGVLRVMRDVLVQSAGADEVIAISREPGILGEAVTVEVSAEPQGLGVPARVVESQPVVVNGNVRHRLRLETNRTSS